MEMGNGKMIRKVKRWGDYNAAETRWGINLGPTMPVGLHKPRCDGCGRRQLVPSYITIRVH